MYCVCGGSASGGGDANDYWDWFLYVNVLTDIKSSILSVAIFILDNEQLQNTYYRKHFVVRCNSSLIYDMLKRVYYS